jgi:hypothetical protein
MNQHPDQRAGSFGYRLRLVATALIVLLGVAATVAAMVGVITL